MQGAMMLLMVLIAFSESSLRLHYLPHCLDAETKTLSVCINHLLGARIITQSG